MIAEVAERMKDRHGAGEKSAMYILATMLGALTISRIVADPKVSNEIWPPHAQFSSGVTVFRRMPHTWLTCRSPRLTAYAGDRTGPDLHASRIRQEGRRGRRA